MVRIAINGYGRIGRVAHRVILLSHSEEVEVVAINDQDVKGYDNAGVYSNNFF